MEMACWFGWFASKDEKCSDYNLSSDIASVSIWHIFLLIMKHCAYVIYVILQFSSIPRKVFRLFDRTLYVSLVAHG